MPFSVDELFLKMINAGRMSRVVKPWGWEVILQTDDFLLKVIRVSDGARTSLQHHVQKSEIHWILAGDGTIEGTADEDLGKMRPSRGLYVGPGTVHRAIGPLLLLEISTPELDDVVRHEDDYNRS